MTVGTPTVIADWALLSKVPGRTMDSEICAASMDPGAAERCVRTLLAGTADGPAPGRPEALPWYGFTGRLGDRPVLGLMEFGWSDELDGTGRPITPARLLIADFDGAARGALTYTGLAAALFDLGWRDVHTGPPGVGDNRMRLAPPPLDVATLVRDIESLGVEFVAGIAALLLDGAQVVLTSSAGQYPSVVERIRLFDAVCALLPYGYRAQLTAATWAGHRARHRISLTFAERAAEGQREVSLDTWAVPAPRTAPAEAYLRTLAALLRRGRSVEQLVQYLMTQREPERNRDAADVAGLLQRLDLPAAVLQAIRAGRAGLGDVLDVLRRLGLEGLDDDEMRQVYCGFLVDRAARPGPEADPAGRALAELWSPPVTRALAERARALLSDGDQEGLRRLAEVAGARPGAARALVGLLTDEVVQQPRPAGIAAYVGLLAHLDPEVAGDPDLHRRFLSRPEAGVQLVAHLMKRPGAVAPVLALWESLVTDDTRWARPIVAVVGGDLAAVAPPDLAALRGGGADAVLTLLAVAEQHERLAELFRLHWRDFAGLAARLGGGEADERRRALLRGHLATLRAQLRPKKDLDAIGRLDVLALLSDQRPETLLSLRGLPEPYLDGMQQAWRFPALRPAKERLVERLREALTTRAARIGDEAEARDLVAVVDRIEPSLRPWAAGLIGTYLTANPDQRASLELSPEWRAAIDPWLAGLTDLARVCADPAAPPREVLKTLWSLLEQPELHHEQVLEALRPWLRPGRESAVIDLIGYLRLSPNAGAGHKAFGEALQARAIDPAGPLREFAPDFIAAVRWMAPLLQQVLAAADRAAPASVPPGRAAPPPVAPERPPPGRRQRSSLRWLFEAAGPRVGANGDGNDGERGRGARGSGERGTTPEEQA
ncbi:hypothetical protein AB0M46_16775 [Dactylosporangium sp. NPDC051485]|uniref:hypothetical protein n=1 Tax=Dactylosporangium sp. NPDC051485 TaxID=3154846 RepID=UPI003417336F